MGVGEECTRGWVPKTVPKVRLVGRSASRRQESQFTPRPSCSPVLAFVCTPRAVLCSVMSSYL